MKIKVLVATLLAMSLAGHASARQRMLHFEGIRIPLQCSQWKRLRSGTWVQTKIISADNNLFQGNRFRNSPQARQLERTCGR